MDRRSIPISFSIVAGVLLLIAAIIIFHYGFKGLGGNPEIRISTVILIGLALTVVFMAILAIVYAVMGVENSQQPLGLPEGSVRALLAFSLVLIFVCLSAFLFAEINHQPLLNEGKTLERATEAQLTDLKNNFAVASELARDPSTGKQIYEQVSGQNGTAVDDLKHPVYRVTYYPKQSKDASDLGKQIFTTLATIFVSVVSFYFGSSATASGAAAGVKAIVQGRLNASHDALTSALADSHNSQVAVDEATKKLQSAQADLNNAPNDPQKRAAVTEAEKALDEAKKNLQEKQAKVVAAQKTAKDPGKPTG